MTANIRTLTAAQAHRVAASMIDAVVAASASDGIDGATGEVLDEALQGLSDESQDKVLLALRGIVAQHEHKAL